MTRVVVIGGSSGIGLATARLCADKGWDVVVASRDPRRADVEAEKVELDVTDAAASRELFGRLGPVDHLVSTTVARAGGPVKELDLGAARHAFETKLWGPLAAIQAADVRESIVLTSGAAAWAPMRGGAATAAVNGAVEALVRTLAVELAPVRVNAVCPGIVDTPTWAGMEAEQREAMFDRLRAALPAGRIGTAEDLAHAIWLLLTNGFVTGTVLGVDGGHRLAAP
jgi:NAD(P)-dependent dehydrogenase (short-subunit alcohol dehydrogenase family)